MEMTDILKKHFGDIETKFGELPEKVREALARLDELEQKAVRRGGGDHSPPASIGAQFITSDAMKSFTENVTVGRRVGFETKATITSATTLADGSAGDLLIPYRDTTVPLARRELTVRDLLPVIPVSGNSVEYVKQTGFTNSAATVAEGATKPQSELQYDLVQLPIRTLAHWTVASRQILDDAPQLQGLIDSELIYGLKYVEDNQLLNGANTGTDLNGIYTQATTFAAGTLVISSPTKIDVLLAAILQNQLANLPVTGIVLHPSDWTTIVATKDSTGGYIIGDPQSAATTNIFGVPVAQSQAMTAGTFLVGDFRGSATLYDRWVARVELSSEDSTNFRENKITILAEERIGLAVKRPTGFTKGSFSTAITDLTS